MSDHPYDDLPGLLFGELDRAEVTAVSNHLASCDDCRRELAVLAATSASLRATARRGGRAGRWRPGRPQRTGLPGRPGRAGGGGR